MLTIVGTRIYLQESDDCSFRVVYKDREGDQYDFKSTDMLTLTIRDRESKNIILQKVSESVKVNGQDCIIFTFKDSEIPAGDYVYDLVLETESSFDYTLIDNANLHIIRDNNPPVEFEVGRLVSLDSKSMYLCKTPLVCNFDYVQIDREEAEGTLVMYDKEVYKKPESSEEGTDDDSLILFNILNDNEDDPDTEDTLILF